MRPARFTDLVTDLAKNTPGCTRVQTLAEVGDTKHPRGLAITTSVGETRWQFMGQLPDGAKHDGFTDQPVTGSPAPAGPAPQATDAPEAWLAALVSHAESPEVAAVERWSTRQGARKGHVGVTVKFHDGSKVFARKL
ncbi:hypothetical protein [Streptomyces sp. NPDC001268]|uniref:hypothetical protein n=1 Tax=Streptomyces sp. NPDC001268 TaxID=3364553 RepID=UPI0036C0632D